MRGFGGRGGGGRGAASPQNVAWFIRLCQRQRPLERTDKHMDGQSYQ